MSRIYQVKLFKGDSIEDLEKQMNEFLRRLPVYEGDNKSPSTRLADSGNVAMVIYLMDTTYT
jgi:hypothetical protein